METLPDGNRRVVYTNYAGQAILNVFIKMSGAQETNQRWYEYRQYDDGGRTLLTASSSAVASYSETQPGLVELKTGSGLIRVNEYYPSSPGTGGAPNRLRYEMVKKGSGGNAVKVREWQYVASPTIGGHTIYRTSKEIEYRSADSNDPDPVETKYDYTWQHFQIAEKTITLPTVPVGQNGSGAVEQVLKAYDAYGEMTWRRNERHYLTKFTYNAAAGALVQRVEDSAGSGAPWSPLPGPHLDLTTDYSVDDLGRVVQELGPVHDIDPRSVDPLAPPTAAISVRRARWTIYHDATYQRWEGMGFQKVSDNSFTLINPVHIERSDDAMRLIDEIQAKRADTAGPLLPTDIFGQETWVRWTRNNYERSSDVANRRIYFAIPASGDGVQGINYNQTRMALS